MTSFSDFLKNLNLNQNPFSHFTTENEGDKFNKIFTHPNDYESIIDSLSSNSSIIILGDRGTGKTALLKDLVSKINLEKQISIELNDFTSLELNFQSKDLYHFLITNISIQLFSSLADKKSKINNLDEEEKIILSYLLKNFVPQISKGYLRDQIKKIQVPWYKIQYKKIEKIIRDFFNYGTTVASLIVDDFLTRHFSTLPSITEDFKIKEYFPELDVNFEEEFLEQDISYSLIERILNIIKKLGYDKVVIFIDRIDEDQRFENDAEAIANYIKLILTDNKLLLTSQLQIIFSTWVIPFNFIKKDVRTQKHNCSILSWSNKDLEIVLNNRLKAFSNNIVKDYKKMFSDDVTTEDFNTILTLANANPRDLWHIFSNLLRSQYNSNSNSNKIEKTNIAYALNTFIKTFNYYEYYPKKTNARANSMDIYSYIEILLKLDSSIFTARQLKDKAQIQHAAAQTHISNMEKIGLISLINPENGSAKYQIRDQKIIYALQKKTKINRT